MPFETIAYLTFVVSAFALFAATLTYAEWASKHANDPVRKPARVPQEQRPHRNDADTVRKAA